MFGGERLYANPYLQHSTAGGNGPQDESVAQQKVEATAENNAASNQSSGYMACIQRNRERIEKGSDAQSSCTKPDLEAERACMENMRNSSQLKCSKSPASGMKLQKHEIWDRISTPNMKKSGLGGRFYENLGGCCG
ncbi:hypothetical protein F0562_011739 [Nyssa sinensis]|uniref:Uncharacterized protein n=1 Tax=Nyssa sinensis TaxID=561372 RepID=A0A5J4ZTX5_9ASTE|nr:hypothetical protein F0562_011739 [Nyssa sinensis]